MYLKEDDRNLASRFQKCAPRLVSAWGQQEGHTPPGGRGGGPGRGIPEDAGGPDFSFEILERVP